MECDARLSGRGDAVSTTPFGLSICLIVGAYGEDEDKTFRIQIHAA
jgi:hypothetical protein